MTRTVLHDMEGILDSIEQDPALRQANRFAARVGAIDRVEFHVLDRIEALQDGVGEHAELIRVKRRALAIGAELDRRNRAVIEECRNETRAGKTRGDDLLKTFDRLGCLAATGAGRAMYDALDALVRALLDAGPVPEETIAREPEMVPLQVTPARIVLEFVDKAQVSERDLFYDIGSGLGQIAVLVHLLTGARACGVEIEPGYCDYARRCAAELALKPVTFINTDARAARYADGTVFFLYTPFRGQMFHQVLNRLEMETRGRQVRLGTYGPCTQMAAGLSWLAALGPVVEDGLAIFERAK